MKYREFPPHEALEDSVRCFWICEVEYPEGGEQEVHPDGCVELIFNFGCQYVPWDSPPPAEPPIATVVGFQDKTIRFRVSGLVRVVAARLRPWAALPLLQESAATLANSVRVLGPAWGGLAGRLRERVDASDYEGAAGGLQDFLLERELAQNADPNLVRAAAKLLLHTQGQYRITELADQVRMSVRQLQRSFRDVVGTSPKALASAYRFERAVRALMFRDDADLTGLALECGYFDQAHFTKDFKQFAGKTPTEFARGMRELRLALQAGDVVFLQSR